MTLRETLKVTGLVLVALIISVVLFIRDCNAQTEYVLAVRDKNGDLVHVMVFNTREACELSGQMRVKQYPGGTYICGPRRVYRPKEVQGPGTWRLVFNGVTRPGTYSSFESCMSAGFLMSVAKGGGSYYCTRLPHLQ